MFINHNKKILAMYSGGLDSLGMVYRLFTAPDYLGYRIHIHHIHHKNIENRAIAEALTVRLALSKMKELGFSFEYTESEISAPAFSNGFMLDIDSINFFAGYICSMNPDICRISTGFSAHDNTEDYWMRRKRADAILSAFTAVERIHPVMSMTKREIYNMLPGELREIFWSCRTPRYLATRAEPCGVCRPCNQLRDQGIRFVS